MLTGDKKTARTVAPAAFKPDGGLMDYVRELLASPLYRFALLITVLLSYGLYITTFPISADDLSGERYISGELLAQGRFTWAILAERSTCFEPTVF